MTDETKEVPVADENAAVNETNGAGEVNTADEIAALTAEVDALVSARCTLEEELATARKENDDLRAKLAKAEQKGTVTRKATKAPKARVAGPIKEPLTGEALRELLKSEAVEIVFSDGRREIDMLPSLQVAGPAWAEISGGRQVLREAQVIGASQRADLVGFALFDSDGAQIGWSALPTPIKLAPGQTVRLDRQILFG